MSGDFDMEAEDGDPDFGNGIESFDGEELGVALDATTPAAQAKVKSYVERIERIEEEMDAAKARRQW